MEGRPDQASLGLLVVEAYSVTGTGLTWPNSEILPRNLRSCVVHAAMAMRSALAAAVVVAAPGGAGAAVPCCHGHCEDAGMMQYGGIASSTFGAKHGGEICADPARPPRRL